MDSGPERPWLYPERTPGPGPSQPRVLPETPSWSARGRLRCRGEHRARAAARACEALRGRSRVCDSEFACNPGAAPGPRAKPSPRQRPLPARAPQFPWRPCLTEGRRGTPVTGISEMSRVWFQTPAIKQRSQRSKSHKFFSPPARMKALVILHCGLCLHAARMSKNQRTYLN